MSDAYDRSETALLVLNRERLAFWEAMAAKARAEVADCEKRAQEFREWIARKEPTLKEPDPL